MKGFLWANFQHRKALVAMLTPGCGGTLGHFICMSKTGATLKGSAGKLEPLQQHMEGHGMIRDIDRAPS